MGDFIMKTLSNIPMIKILRTLTSLSIVFLQGMIYGQKYIFTDVTQESHLSSFEYPIVYATWVDYDSDMDLDVFVSCPGAKNALFQNQGDRTFLNIIQVAGIEDSIYSFCSSAWGDIDNDGDHDLFIPFFENWAERPLYRNEGNGVFLNLNPGTGLEYDGEMIDAAWFDYNGDRLLDLICTTGENNAILLFRNEGNCRFTEASADADLDSISVIFPKGLAVADYDLDGNIDFYVSERLILTHLFQNEGDGTFNEVWEAGTMDSANASTVSWGDYNNDGYPDIFVANHGFKRGWGWLNSLFRNNGDGTFASVGEEAGLEMWSSSLQGIWVDFNNDGFLDLHVIDQNPDPQGPPIHRLFENNRDETFIDVFDSTTLKDENLGSYVAWGDYDGDGDMDAFFGAINWDPGTNRLFRNESQNHWIGVRLESCELSGNPVGSKVKVYFGDKTIVRELNSGSVLVPQVDSQTQIGLGDKLEVDSLEVLWPSGLKESEMRVKADQYLVAREGSGFQSNVLEHTLEPRQFNLYPNFPNPFNPYTLIRYDIAKPCRIKLKVYDGIGREVATLKNGDSLPGSYRIEWKAKGIATGLYILKLEAGGLFQTRKMIVIR